MRSLLSIYPPSPRRRTDRAPHARRTAAAPRAHEAPAPIAAPLSTPADVYFDALQRGGDGVPWEVLAHEPESLERAARAFRAAESDTTDFLQRCRGWTEANARRLAQDLSRAAGEWLLCGASSPAPLYLALHAVWQGAHAV